VAVGASAGGIGMAFVLVQHLDPKHHSILIELLARKTAMTVTEVSEGLPVKSNAQLPPAQSPCTLQNRAQRAH
jgi:two-component system CheB/CheR fusion protein